MDNGSNKVILLVASLLVACVIVLLLVSGGCHRGGSGGGGASAGASSTTAASGTLSSTNNGGQTTDAGAATTPTNQKGTAAQTSTGQSGSQWATGDYETDYQRLMQELGADTNTGSNARDPQASATVKSATETYQELSQRGFSDFVLESEFDMSGTMIGETEIDEGSTEQYPSYRTVYLSAKGVFWIIVVNDGQTYAVPMASQDAEITREIILTETDHITQYDGATNKYSDWTFAELLSNGIVGVQVPHIDTATLDSYSVADLEGM